MNTISIPKISITQNKKSQNVFYRRVSSLTQSFARQEIPDVEFDKIFEEKISGKNKDRAELKNMLSYIREGDHVYVYDLSRLGRNMIDLDNIIKQINEKGASITFYKEKITHSPNDNDPFKLLQRQMLSSYAEFERNLVRMRTQEGIEKAKANGTWHLKMTDEKIAEMKELKNMGLSVVKIAEKLNVSRQTIYNVLKENK